jgi:hypothetical protein
MDTTCPANGRTDRQTVTLHYEIPTMWETKPRPSPLEPSRLLMGPEQVTRSKPARFIVLIIFAVVPNKSHESVQGMSFSPLCAVLSNTECSNTQCLPYSREGFGGTVTAGLLWERTELLWRKERECRWLWLMKMVLLLLPRALDKREGVLVDAV